MGRGDVYWEDAWDDDDWEDAWDDDDWEDDWVDDEPMFGGGYWSDDEI